MLVWLREISTRQVRSRISRCQFLHDSAARSPREWPASEQQQQQPQESLIERRRREHLAARRARRQQEARQEFPETVDTTRKRMTKAEKRKWKRAGGHHELRRKRELGGEPPIYQWQAMPAAELLEEQGLDELRMISTRAMPGGPTERDNCLISANMPFPYRTRQQKLEEHARLMATIRHDVSVVEAENARHKWSREAPDKLRRWQRDYILMELYKEEKREKQAVKVAENMSEVEKRYSRRVQGLPESDDEEERVPWRSPEILKRLRRKKPKRIQPPPFHSLWVKRPRNLNAVYTGVLPEEMDNPSRSEDHQQESGLEEGEEEGVEEEQDEGARQKAPRTEEELSAREDRRFDRFQRYVEKLVPRFEDHPSEVQASSPSLLEAVESGGTTTQLAVVKPTYEVPPLIPGRGAVIVASLSEILNAGGTWDNDKVATLEKFKHAKILPYQVCEVLKRVRDWRVALEFFTWAKSVPFFKHDAMNYSMMIRVLGTCGNYTQGRKLFDEMREKGLKPDLVTVNNMIKCYGSANRVDDAMDLFREFPDFGFEPDVCTYALLIDLLGKAGRVSEVRKLFLELQSRKLKPDEYVFNSMIANFSKWKDLGLADEALDYMKVCGIRPSTVTYAIVLNMYAKSLNFMLAEKIYCEYLNSNLPPDLYVYNNAILFFGLAGRCREAEWAVEDIEKAGLVPDKFSYCTIISAWARQGCAPDAKKWFDKARSRGITPSPEMCNALIDAYIKALDLEPVAGILDAMPGWGVKATLQTYTYLFNYYCECCKEYVDLLRDYMRKTGHPADKFLEDVLGGKVPLQQLRRVSQRFFDSLRLERSGWASKFADALVHYLQTYGYEAEAHEIFAAAAATRLFRRNLWENANDHWFIWLVDMDEGTALVGLKQGLLISRDKLRKEPARRPAMATVVTGFGKHRETRSALAVRSALEELDSPFRTDLVYARLESRGDLFAEWLAGNKIELDIPFNHPDYVYPPNTRVCLRFTNL